MNKIIKILLILFAFLVFLDTFFIEPNLVQFNTKRLNVPCWNNDLNGFKVALVSDIHLGTRFVDINKLNKIVDNINKNNPDIVVICGDLDALAIVDKNYSITEVANSLKNIKSKYGIFAIMGNHDYLMSDIIGAVYQKSDIKLLKDDDSFINVNGKKIRIVGLEDLWFRNSSPRVVIGENNEKLPTIVLAHNPDYFPRVSQNTTITLSGHTHGGEICLPFIGSLTVPSEYGNRYRSGHIVENNKHLFVSRGVATLSFGRFMSPPEVNILELYSQTEKCKDTKKISGNQKPFSPELIIKIKELL